MGKNSIREFQNVCKKYGDFELIEIQRHNRAFCCSNVSMDDYVQAHMPSANEIELSHLRECKSYADLINFKASLEKDGFSVRDTLMGFFVSEKDAEQISLFMKAYKPLQELFSSEFASVGAERETALTKEYTRFCKQCKVGTTLARLCFLADTSDWYYNGRLENHVKRLIDDWLQSENSCKEAAPLVDQVSDNYISKSLKVGKTKTVTTPTARTRLPSSQIKVNRELEVKYVSLREIANELAKETSSKFNYSKNTPPLFCRDRIHQFIEGNEAWGVDIITAEMVADTGPQADELFFYRKDKDNVARHLRIWVATFSMNDREKLKVLLDYKKEEWPETVKLLSEYYLLPHKVETDGCAKATVDFLFSILPEEINHISEKEIKEAIVMPFIAEELSMSCIYSIDRFLYESKLTKHMFNFQREARGTIDVSPYSIKQFSVIKCISMDIEQIKKRKLIQKAVENKRFAAAWLFIILHFFAAWRKTDFICLKAPDIPYTPKETLERINDGRFTEEEAISVAADERAILDIYVSKANKTKRYSGTTQLQLYLHKEEYQVVGLILAIATAHYQLSPHAESFILPANDVYTLKLFFGQDFSDACDNKNFSTRKANKSFLQALQAVSEGTFSYLIPSIARNHKMGYGELSPTTAVYLADNKTTNLTPEHIIQQLGDRGFCGFTKQMLLEKAFGNQFEQLPFEAQTALIVKMDLTAAQLDGIKQAVSLAQERSTEAVKEILRGSCNKSDAAKQVLLRLIQGKGKGKGSICGLLAAGKPCVCINRQSCIGCQYEILTRRLIFHLKCELDKAGHNLLKPKVQADHMEVARQKYLIEQVISPSIYEICQTATCFSDQQEIASLVKLAIEEENKNEKPL